MNRFWTLLVLAALPMSAALCNNLAVDAEAVKSQWAGPLGIEPGQIVFARHVNVTWVPQFAKARLVRGQIPSNFRSAVMALTPSAVMMLSDNPSRPTMLMRL